MLEAQRILCGLGRMSDHCKRDARARALAST